MVQPWPDQPTGSSTYVLCNIQGSTQLTEDVSVTIAKSVALHSETLEYDLELIHSLNLCMTHFKST